MQRRTSLNPSPHSSHPSSPVITAPPQQNPFVSPLNPSDPHSSPRRLLIPTVRPTRAPPRPQRSRTGRLTGQSRSASISSEIQIKENREWASSLGRLCVVEDPFEIHGFQLYAVEKWVVQRGRLITVVSVYTGDPRHKIVVTPLCPFSSLSDAQAQAEFDNAVHILRRDGARPRETEQGVILITSLANFRSDYNLVLIPDGNFLTAREQLYVNINLLRMGCSGRTALTLQEPSALTKDRFLSMYCFSEPIFSASSVPFNYYVLELVKLVQSALALFGMFDVSMEEPNGLLCDTTVEGIQQWTDRVGQPMLSLEPMERVADPTVASALLSLIVTTRNKLHAIGITQVPKDPFQDLSGFMQGVAILASQRSSSGIATTSGFLTLETVDYINDTYDRRRLPDYRVPRIILGKLDEITTELNLRGSGDPANTNGPIYMTADLAGFVYMVLGASSRDGVESLKSLWTGKFLHHRKKVRRDGADEDDREPDGKSTEEEDGAQRIFQSWPRHMKIEGLKGFDFGLGRSKRPSVDLTSNTRTRSHRSFSGDEATLASPPRLLPAHVISGQAEQGSAIGRTLTIGNRDSGPDGSTSAAQSILGVSPVASAESSKVNLASLEMHVPSRMRSMHPMRLSSAPDTMSHLFASSKEESRMYMQNEFAYKQSDDNPEGVDQEDERRAYGGLLLSAGRRRRHSLHDLSNEPDRPRLSVERMKIDVGLCGQYLIMHRRELHLQNITVLLQHLRASLHATNQQLQGELDANETSLDATSRLRHDVLANLNTFETRCTEWNSVQEMLRYQTEQMSMRPLWRSVRQQRNRVLAARQAVFSAPQGTRPAPGTAKRHFFRVQTTLDPHVQRLVDWMGRTESEAEEENVIPHDELGAEYLPPYEELRAYTEATRVEAPRNRWWWPFGGDTRAANKGSDDENSAAAA